MRMPVLSTYFGGKGFPGAFERGRAAQTGPGWTEFRQAENSAKSLHWGHNE